MGVVYQCEDSYFVYQIIREWIRIMTSRKRPAASLGSHHPAIDTAYQNSEGAPAMPPHANASQPALQRARAVGETVDAMPCNASKASEYGKQSVLPTAGATVQPASATVTRSTLSEDVRASAVELLNTHRAAAGRSIQEQVGEPIQANLLPGAGSRR